MLLVMSVNEEGWECSKNREYEKNITISISIDRWGEISQWKKSESDHEVGGPVDSQA